MNSFEDSKPQLSADQQVLLALRQARSRVDALLRERTEPLAIIGLGCRFPGESNTPASFWKMMRNGVNAVGEVPADRWPVGDYFDTDPQAAGKTYSRWGGFIKSVQNFDAIFFGVAPREAARMDPQQRLFLEVVWEACERAGIAPPRLRNSKTAVFVGLTNADYLQLQAQSVAPEDIDAYLGGNSSFNMVAGRLSYFLGLQGPSMAIDTACSSSLVAVDRACRSLRSRECNLAIAGGVNVNLLPESYICMSRWGMLAPDGRCKTFDDAADGFVRGEGCGAVLLKRLSDAERDGDRIFAVIRGSAVNQDGPSGGLSIPNGLAQEAVIREALANGGVEAREVSYVEAHGTGTSLGDPIEVQALGEVLCAGRSKSEPLYIGSVKTNIGHLEAAAGIAGLIKVVLSLQHGEIPAHLHLKRKSSRIAWERYALEVPVRGTEWKAVNGKRIAGVSSFGFSGTNAHVIVEEAPERKVARVEKDRPVHVLTVSAKSEAALQEMVTRYREHLEEHAEESLADVAYTANAGRAHFAHRVAVVAENAAQAGKRLQEAERKQVRIGERPKIAFLFSGQGSQYAGMGRELYESSEVYRAGVDRCVKAAEGEMKRPLLEVMWGDEKELGETRYTQPALYALEWGLAELWKSWGIEPSVVLGHSVGEYVAAAVAGVLGVEEGMRLVVERGRLMQGLGAGGAMLAVRAGVERVREVMEKHAGRVSVGAVNGPESVVLSGWADGIGEIEKELGKQGVVVKRLGVSHGFHSPQMEGMLGEWEKRVGKERFAEPRVRMIVNVSGEVAGAGEITKGEYWVRQVREAVEFGKGMETAAGMGIRNYLEIGPQAVLIGMGMECLAGKEAGWYGSLRKKGRGDWQELFGSVQGLYEAGAEIDWEGMQRGQARRKVELPTYAFQRERYWVERKKGQKGQQGNKAHQEPAAEHPGEGIGNWFHEIKWELAPRVEGCEKIDLAMGQWLIFADQGGTGKSLATLLSDAGQKCTLVFRRTGITAVDTSTLVIDPNKPEHFIQLAKKLAETGSAPLRGVVHLWPLDEVNPVPGKAMEPLDLEILSCGAVLHLSQALLRQKWANPPRLSVVTRASQTVTPNQPSVNPGPASLWGFRRVLASEHPELQSIAIDLDTERSASEAQFLFDEILSTDREDEVASRGGERWVPRLVPQPQPECMPSGMDVKIRPDATYLLTGGLGGLGLSVARWLVARGARHLVLLGRGEATAPAVSIIRELEQAGATVATERCDVAVEHQLAAVVQKIQREGPALRGVIHAAGILDDVLLSQQNWARFEAVMAPKISGAWNLHRQTLGQQLDFFVLFSSASSILSSPRLGSYASANAFLDAFAGYRRSVGLPALSVNWGVWSESGMAARAAGSAMQTLSDRGMGGMTNEEGLRCLERAMSGGASQVVVLPVNWSMWRQAHPAYMSAPLLSKLQVEETGSPALARSQKAISVRALFLSEPASEQRNSLARHVRERALAVLGLASTHPLDERQPLQEMGMDSLMTVELRNTLAASLELALPSTLVFDYPTIETMAAFIFEEIRGSETRAVAATDEEKKEALNDLENMSDSEAEALLLRELETQRNGKSNV